MKKHWITLSLFLFPCLVSAQSEAGLHGEYFDGKSFDRLVMTRQDAEVNFVWDNVAPHSGMDAGNFSVRWQGQIRAPKTGKYLFRAVVDDGIRLWINGQSVISAWGMNDSEPFSGSIALEGGKQYDIKVEYFNGLYEGEIQLRWQLPGEEPFWGGLMGHNDKPIDRQYFSSKTPPPPPKQTPPAKPQKTPPPKPAKPAPVPAKTTPPIAADTLEKYLPKNIIFEKSKAVMLSGSFAELDNLAGFLKRNPAYRLRIEGHTDNVGDTAKNLTLSQERAKSVASYLTSKGIAAERMEAKGFGDTRPLFGNGGGKGDARNRRVEFFIE